MRNSDMFFTQVAFGNEVTSATKKHFRSYFKLGNENSRQVYKKKLNIFTTMYRTCLWHGYMQVIAKLYTDQGHQIRNERPKKVGYILTFVEEPCFHFLNTC